MESGNLAWPEKMAGACRLLEVQIERKDRRGAGGRRVGQLLETDALGAKIGVGKLFLRWRRLARVADAVRKRCLLRGEQQQREKTEKEASQFHDSNMRWSRECSALAGKCQGRGLVRRRQTDQGSQMPFEHAQKLRVYRTNISSSRRARAAPTSMSISSRRR